MKKVSLDKLERATLRTTAKILEERAEVSDRVVISAQFARLCARYIRQLLGESD